MLLWFTAYILIPVYTIMFVQGNNWFTTNFSVIGNQLGRQEAFVLWGLLVGIYFFFSLRVIVVQMAVPPKSTWLIPLALFLLTCAVITPYLPEILPLRSTLHIVFSFMAALCLILSIGSILLRLYQDDRKKIPALPDRPGRHCNDFSVFAASGRHYQQCSGNFFHNHVRSFGAAVVSDAAITIRRSSKPLDTCLRSAFFCRSSLKKSDSMREHSSCSTPIRVST